jgi:hypothetical protein
LQQNLKYPKGLDTAILVRSWVGYASMCTARDHAIRRLSS